MSDKQMKTLEQFEAEMDEFNRTSFWTYLNRCDQENIERKIKKNIWYPVKRFFSNIKYWFVYRFHPKRRYHVVSTGLPAGYYDVDHRMLHCCFNLLKEYVEFELGGVEKLSRWVGCDWKKEGFSSKSEFNSYVKRDLEIETLYCWWLNRPNRKDPYENWRSKDNHSWKSAFEIEQGYDAEDQEMLIRLMKIRSSLWT